MVKRGLYIILFLCLLCLPIVLADDISLITYGNSTSLVRNQDLEYLSCIDGNHSFDFTQLICLDNYATIKTSASKISDSCYYTNVNLEKYGCNEYTIESYYTSGGNYKKITKDVATNAVLATPTFILDAQEWDGGWGNAANTAYAIWVLSKFGSVYSLQINDGMNWLKDNRRNEPKCWVDAQGVCSPTQTIKALAYLKLANIAEGNRIVNDGIAYVESLQKYSANTAWVAKITATQDNTYCNLTSNGAALISQVFLNDSQEVSKGFTASYGAVLNMSCSEKVTLELDDSRGTTKFSYTFSADSAVDFDDGMLPADEDETFDQRYKIVKIQQPCWSSNTTQWSSCDPGLTVYALSLGIDSAHKTIAKTWLDANLQNHSVVGKFVSSVTPELDSAFYLYAVDSKNEDVRDWLIYSQNNDGSFGSGSNLIKIPATATAYLALENLTFLQRSEVLRDSAHWLSLKYTGKSYDNVITDASQFQILSKNSRPYLRSLTDGITTLNNDEKKTVQFKPVGAQQISGLQSKVYTVAGVAADMLTVTIPPKVDGNSTLAVTLQSKVTAAGNISGYVIVSGLVDNENVSRELRRIYFTSHRDSVFGMSVKQTDYNAYDNQFNYLFSIDSINVAVTCDVQLQSDKLVGAEQIKLTKVGVYELPLTLVGVKAGKMVAAGTLVCTKTGSSDEPTVVPFDINVYVHDKFPFSVDPQSLSITSYKKSFSFKVKNLENEPMDLKVEAKIPSELYTLEPFESKVAAGKSVTVIFSTTYLDSENITATNIIEVTAFDKTIELPLDIQIVHVKTSLGFIIGFTLSITLLLTTGFIIYNWKSLGPQFNDLYQKILRKTSRGKLGKVSANVMTAFKKKDLGRETMMDIISIMQSMDKTDIEIIARLESEGYTRPLIEGLIAELKEVQAKVSSIKREDTVLGIIKGLDANVDVVSKVLKEKGYSENDIREAFKELTTDTDVKEKNLRKEVGVGENERLN